MLVFCGMIGIGKTAISCGFSGLSYDAFERVSLATVTISARSELAERSCPSGERA
jgi:anion-transporting  ArsA/GET3 family ATPase